MNDHLTMSRVELGHFRKTLSLKLINPYWFIVEWVSRLVYSKQPLGNYSIHTLEYKSSN